MIGRVINDRFRIVSVIARGGMGKVYRAEQAPLGRQIALKVLEATYEGDSDPEFHKRFFLEASTQSKLTHPNTVTIFDYGKTEDDVYFIAMELLEGRTLHRYLRDEAPLSASKATHIARQICRSLREAHSLGIIHRDLKPANVFLVQHGEQADFVKVLDFGLVKDLGDKGEDLTQTGLFMGSPKYMSPEQIRGDRVDGRADIYALGVLLYEMLTGRAPFERPNSVNILMAHVHEDVPPMATHHVEVHPALEGLVRRALAKAPGDRFSSMDEMLSALTNVASEQGLAVSRSGDLGISGEFAGGSGSTTLSRADLIVPSSDGGLDSLGGLTSSSDAQARRGSAKWVLLVALLLLSVLAVAFALVRSGRSGDEAPAPVVATPAAPTEPEHVDDVTPSSPGALTTEVTIVSEPPGAQVRIGDSEEVHTTPVSFTWTGDDARRGRSVTFRFQLEGYRDLNAVRTVVGREMHVSGRLQPIDSEQERARRPPTTSRSTSTSGSMEGSESSVGLMGYKLEPY
ncbi:MAG: serine/threonine-protein kinase [Polyangiales bacterium]|nr:serine/threonine protein kinase [Myxococcales bacterium]MCB9657610.1 serine/threonine protein kinase [Sandaracinaceae bacterium]